MLVLSRLEQEGIQLSLGGKTVRILVVRIDRNKVRLGIEAPQDVSIARDELLEQREREAWRGAV